MEQESSVEFHQRWIATAESDLQYAKHEFFKWMCLLIVTAAARFAVSHFVPRSGWCTAAYAVLMIPLGIFFVKAALASSNVGDAKKFLRTCRADLTSETQETCRLE